MQAHLMRQRDQALTELHRLRADQPGRYAFHFRHLILRHVLTHAPEAYNAAHAAAYAAINAEGAQSYDDVVAGLEAQVEALRVAGHQAAQALREAHALLEQLPVVGVQPLGRFHWHQETGPAAIAALEKAGVMQ
jgi:hypothetical protein